MPLFQSKRKLPITPEQRQKGLEKRRNTVTVKEREFVIGLVSGKSQKQAAMDAFRIKPDSAQEKSGELLKKPKIQREIDIALEKAGFGTDYATAKMKKLMEAGEANLESTRPGDMIHMLELWMKAKGIIGGTNRIDPAEQQYKDKVKKMEFTELRKQIEEMDKRQRSLLAKIDGRTEEGEVVK